MNTNLLGIPQTIKDNFMEIIDIVGKYPDSECKQLLSCLALKYNILPKHILCGNGADDLLYRLIFTMRQNVLLLWN